jgi:two-component system, cell cycle sensor histidine kinase and response regulator CckA
VSWWSIPPVIMASITGYVGAYHLLVFFRARRDREHLAFAALCATLATYDLLCAGLYNAATPVAGGRWQVGQAVVGLLGGMSFLWFVAEHLRSMTRHVVAVITGVGVPLLGLLLLGPRSWLVTDVPFARRVELPFGLDVSYNEMAVGPLFTLENCFAAVVIVYTVVLAVGNLGSPQRARVVPLLVATGVFSAGLVSDVLVALGTYRFVYLAEYAFMGMIVLMAFSMLSELLRTSTVEEALLESRRFNELIVGAIPGVVYVFDLPERRAVYANTNVASLLGYGPDEVAAMGEALVPLLAHPDDLPQIQSLLARWERARDGDVLTSEYRIKAKDGQWRWWLGRDKVFKRKPDGSVWQIIGSAHDITERRLAEQALKESEERYRALIEASPSGILLISAEGRMIFANPAAARIVGVAAPADLLGRAVLDFVHPSFIEVVVGRLRARLASPGIPEPFVGRVVRPDGEPRDVELVGARVTHEGAPAVLAVGNDITDRIRAEEERVRLEGQLRQAQKMEAVGRLAGGVAHDFNNLLQAILSYTEVLLSRVGDREAMTAGLAELSEHARRGARLTRQLLVFSRREATHLEVVDLGAVILEAATLVRRLLRENIAFEVDLANVALPVRADKSQLEQVVMNLALNAADAMPGGGELVIRTGAGPGEMVWLEVADSGCGIPEEIRDRIFEPFFTTKESSEGSGLGLSVVHVIVTRHGGSIELESRVGSGSTFRVLLPRPEPPTRRDAAIGVPLRAPGLVAGSGQRVLVVEDEPGARQALVEILSMLSFRVLAVGSVAEARALPPTPAFDIALSDVLLPDGVGNELASELAARWPGLAVILMSGYAEDREVREAVARGEVRFLQKPFDMASLSQELNRALAARG